MIFNLSEIYLEIQKLFEINSGKFMNVSFILYSLDFTKLFIFEKSVKFPPSSIMKLYLFRLIKGIRTYDNLQDYLIKHEEEAFQLGFYKGEDNQIELPPKRTYNFYLQNRVNKDQREQLNLIAEKILTLATKNKVTLDLEIVKKAIKEKKKSYEQEIKNAVKLVKKLVYPQIDLKIKENGKFTTKDLLDVLVHVALTHDFTNNGSFTFKEANPSRKTPSGDLMMYHFSKFDSVEKLRNMFEKILDVIFDFTKRNYNLLQKRKLDVAYDIHKIPYFGKNISYSCGGQYERGTSEFLQFLTCSIAVAGKRFILDIVPVHPADILPKLLDRSLERIKRKIKVEKVLMDRGFNSGRIINILKKHKLHFLMPMVRTITVKKQFDVYEGLPYGITKDFQIGKGNNSATVNLTLVNDRFGVKKAFICNFDMDPEYTYKLYEMYRKRWGIETSYRNLAHDFKAKTTTNNYNIRLFYFLFSACVFNLWVLVNICLSLTLYGRIKDKPLITAKMFATLLYRVQEDYFDPGG